jgi:endogenous inhibitor of DNA gyrase (YacG/DUF329 family)
MPRCPICDRQTSRFAAAPSGLRPASPRTKNAAFPFCSPRCKQVDLGKWLNEEYRVPVPDDSPEDEAPNAQEEA